VSQTQDYFEQAAQLARQVADSDIPGLTTKAGELMAEALESGGKIMFCGNGGSAADAQHLAAEFTGHLVAERSPLPGLALTTDTSALTAIGNDYSYDQIFVRQVQALGKKGDVLVCISTSGGSGNVVKAAEAARQMGVIVIALVGPKTCPLDDVAKITLHLPGETAGQIQQGHITAGHALCAVAERSFL
jgi:D-sedoheptulose 7-phosphate isomerase